MMRLVHLFVIVVATVTVITGCTSQDNSRISRQEVNQIQTSRIGTIETLNVVEVEGQSSSVGGGAIAGTVAGGALGSTVGSGRGRTLGVVTGAVVGNTAGRAAQNRATRAQGLQLGIRLEDGQFFQTVIIPDSVHMYRVGDRVNIVTSTSGNMQIDRIQ